MQARGCLSLFVSSAAGVALTFAGPATANGRFPQASQMVFSSNDSHLVVLRTTFGLLISHDDGATWGWVCETAIGLGAAQEDPSYGVTRAGAIVGALWQGLAVSPNEGCDWGFIGGPLATQRMVDLVVRPDDPHVVLALTGTWLPEAGAPDGAQGDYYQSQIFRSADDGATWSALGVPIDPTVTVTTLEVAATDPHRVYVSGTRGHGTARTAQLFVSQDDGTSWTERPVPLNPTVESGVYIGAVDPTNADLVYLRTDAQSRLLVTNDAGKSFRVASFVVSDGGTTMALNGYMFGFALSPDGSKIYAGGVGADGLYVGTREGSALLHRSDLHVECLTTRGSELWACSDEASGFLSGMSTDDGATFLPKLHLDGVGGVLQCGDASGVSQCAAQYSAQCKLLGGCEGGEPGGGTGGSDAGVTSDAGLASGGEQERASGGCSAAGGGASASLVIISATVLAVSRRRRRT
jgi:uncharacterized protein (TIGR03382 family)